MTRVHASVLFLVLLLAMLGIAAWAYPQLPALAPTHWDASGVANGWMPRFWAAAIWPLLMAGTAGLLALLPVISPRRFEITPFVRVYWVLGLAVQACLFVIGACALLAAAGYPVSIPIATACAVGGLFVVLGNYMGKFRKNFFVGIRTPWTLASDAVWERTHRLGGRLFVLAGLAGIAVGLARAPTLWLVWIAATAALIPCVYSWIVYRRLEGGRPGRSGRPP